MRLVLIGQAAFAEKVLDGLRAHGHEVAAVYCPPDRPGAKPDPVRIRAETLGIPVRQHKSMKTPQVQAEFADLKADLGVLAYVTQIVSQAVIDTPRFGSICFHPSLLPRYRGGSAIPWQIIKGETETGVTVFWPDSGIDTGPILLQKPARISPDDSAASLYYNTLFPIGVEAMIESVDLIAAGKAPRIEQDHSLASYDPLLSDVHVGIDWNRPVAEVHNLIRGADPQPGAHVQFNETKLRFFEARRADDRHGQPGLILEIGDKDVLIGTLGGAVRIGRMKIGDRKIPAAEALRELQIQVGDSLSKTF